MAENISTTLGAIVTDINTLESDFTNYTNNTPDTIAVEPWNKEALALTRLIVQRILVPVITTVGLFGNIISISVLTRKCMLSSTNCYLTTLSVFDLLYLVFSFVLSLKHYTTIKPLTVYMYIYPYTRVLTDICSNVSVFLTVTFSLERLIAVCFPMKGRTICTPERARIITIIITLCAMTCTTPEFFEWKTVHITENNVTKVIVKSSEFADTVSYQVGYNYFLIFTFTVLPLILLSTFNGILIKSVLAATRMRREMTYNVIAKDCGKRNNEQTRITLMLIGVVVVFLLCQFPNAAVMLYRCYIELKDISLSREELNSIIIAGNVVNLLVLINASVNFVLYSVMSTKFRRVFLQMFCRLIHRNQEPYSRTEMTYYNSTFAKSQSSPLRYRSKRITSVSANGVNRQVSSKDGYLLCPSDSSNHIFRNSIRESKRSLRESAERALSKNTSCGRKSSKDDLYKVHDVDTDITVWECTIPLPDSVTEQAKETTHGQRNGIRSSNIPDTVEIVHSNARDTVDIAKSNIHDTVKIVYSNTPDTVEIVKSNVTFEISCEEKRYGDTVI